MKETIKVKVAVVMLILSASVQWGFSQGSLSPSSGPSAIMKSLDQIQPRTPIPFTGYGISFPGSYYFTTNLVGASGLNGISIFCDNVTIDLEGFTLQGVSGSISGINISGTHTNITILNGVISGWGGDGIDGGLSGQNLTVQHVAVCANVVNGIAGNNCIISDCCVENNQWNGITVVGNYCRISRNTVSGNNSAAHSNGAGILIEGSNNLIEDNFVSGTSGPNGVTVFSGSTGNVITRNCVIGWLNSDFSVAVSNDLGPLGTATNSTSPWANIAR